MKRVAVFAAHESPVWTDAAAAITAAGGRPVNRNPKYFTVATLTDRYDAVVVDLAHPRANEIGDGFHARGVPTYGINAGSSFPPPLLALLRPPAFAPVIEPTPHDAPLEEMSRNELRELAKQIGASTTGTRADMEAAIRAKRGELLPPDPPPDSQEREQ